MAARSAVAGATGAAGSTRESALAGIAAAEAELRDLATGATTIVVCVVDSGCEAALARVGDSTAFVVGGEDEQGWRELFAPPADHEAEVPVVTGAIEAGEGSLSATVETVEVSLEGTEVVAVVSDGIAGPWRDGPTTVAPAMVDGLVARPTPLELATLADFSRQGCHDDRTIVAVWPAETWSRDTLSAGDGLPDGDLRPDSDAPGGGG